MVKARFFVQSITQSAGFAGTEVTLQAVSRGPENKEWAQATPSGTVKMTISNPAAAEWFVSRLRKDVTLTFADSDDAKERTSPYGD